MKKIFELYIKQNMKNGATVHARICWDVKAYNNEDG